MKNKVILIMISAILLAVISLSLSNKHNQKVDDTSPNFEIKKQPIGENYDDLWEEVLAFEKKGLYESALKKVNEIYNKAYTASNANQLIKTTIYKIKYNQQMAEDDYVLAIDDLSKLIKTSTSPQKQILHSLTAQVYWGYYQQNRWKYNQRTQTDNFEQNDIRTWSLEKIVSSVLYHYDQSLTNSNETKILALTSFKEILTESHLTEGLRPTLYDFLAHRALDFYKNTEPELTKPAYAFVLDHKEVFSEARSFVKYNLMERDTTSTKRKAFELFQELTHFHLEVTKNQNALALLELERLNFAREYAVITNKDTLYFTALKNIALKYRSTPIFSEINHQLALFYTQRGGNYKNDLKDDVQNEIYKGDKKRALALCLEGINKYPTSYGAKLCERLRDDILAKSMSFTTDDVSIPNKPSKGLLTFKNLQKVYVKVIPVKYDKLAGKSFKNNKEKIDFYNKLPEVESWQVDVTHKEDYLERSTEIKIPSLSHGYYLIMTSDSKNFSYDSSAVGYSFLWKSHISYVSRQNETEEYEFTVLNRETSEPLKGVKAKVYYEKYNYSTSKYIKKHVGNFTTNNEGYFVVPPSDDYRNLKVEFKHHNDELILGNSYYQSKQYEQNNNRLAQGHLFIDRGIYRPGQTIYFKGIVLKENNNKASVLSSQEVLVEFYDANYQKVDEKILKTNEFGTVSGSFVAPQNGMNGQMRIQLSLKSGYRLTTKYFNVEEYKRPKFEVDFKPITGSYKLSENITIEGFSKAFAGNNIDGAKVNYRVTRTASFPWWCRYYWGYTPNSPEMEITSGATNTDNNGIFKINFKAIPDKTIDPKYTPTYSYRVTADVTDINGETRSATTYVSVGYKALTVKVNIKNEIDKNDELKFDISSTNLNGEHVASKGTITIYKFKKSEKLLRDRKWSKPNYFIYTKKEHDAVFPYDVYKNEDKLDEREKEKVKTFTYAISDTTQNTSELNLNKIDDLKPGNYQLEINTKDKFGTEVKEIQNFMVFDATSTQSPINEFSWIKQITHKAEPNKKAKFLLATAAQNVNILYEVEHQGEITSKKWITLTNEQKLIEIPVLEKHRGNFAVHFTFIKENRVYHKDLTVMVPFSNKELDVTFETFRDKLYPGQKEKWKVNMKGPKGEKVAAEMLATMYDASLDQFKSNSFYLNIYNYYYNRLSWNTYNGGFGTTYQSLVSYYWNPYKPYSKQRQFAELNLFGANFGNNYYSLYGARSGLYFNADMVMEESEMDAVGNAASPGASKSRASNNQQRREKIAPGRRNYSDKDEVAFLDDEANDFKAPGKKVDLGAVKARTNFNETAFFYPELRTNSKGDINFEFEVPEALTKWKFLSVSHTKDLKVGYLSDEIVTQKDLMVVPNTPRFFREGDKITLSSKVSNISKENLSGKAQLFLFDALTMNPIDADLMNTNAVKSFTAEANKSTSISWNIEIPFGYQSIVYKIVAASGDFSDGEQKALPVLTNRMLVTEPMPLPIRKKGTKTFTFDKLVNSTNSSTLKHHKLTLEYTSNPAWYVIQAMPYMMEYPYECAEQTFTRYYANSLATHIMNGNPKIKQIIESWKDVSPNEFLSSLEKNEELKAVLLEETPWVLEAKDEQTRKKRIAQLFDLNKMTNELDLAMRKLQKMQVSNGAWPWFKGGRENRYITQHIVTGMGHLDHLGVKNVRNDNDSWKMVRSAIGFLDKQIVDDLKDIKKYDEKWKENKHLSNSQIQYLYARTFFNNIKMNNATKEAYEYFLNQSKKHWLDYNNYTQGMIALANYRNPVSKRGVQVEQEIMASLKERAIKNDELGMYWKGMMDGGYYWYQAPVETQALLIEAFQTITGDKQAVEDLKAWLLKQKQTSDWKTTKATANACYALLLNGTDLLANNDLVEVKVGNYEIDYSGKPTTDKFKKQVKADAGTGYFKTAWAGSEVTPNMGNISVTKQHDGVAWGAVYWQYFEDLDKITSHETPLKLKKKLFKQKITDRGEVLEPIIENNVLEVGDKVIVRIELQVDRRMEYVHMKDMRASGFEPLNVISRYKWQDGLGYYESTKDASTNFFFDELPRGTYIFEYPLRAFQKGDFSNGITSIQCMYAPEFASHSEGIRVKVK